MAPELPPETEVFAEPWEARAFALAIELQARGHFQWAEFRARLIEEIAADQSSSSMNESHPGPEPKSGYYQCWLRALERLTLAKGLLGKTDLDQRADSIAASPPARTRAQGREPIRIA